MGIIAWIVLGLVVGVLAKFIMPGKDPGGLFVTIAIGIAGAFVGGYLGGLMGVGSVTGLNFVSLALATAGALLLLFLYRMFKGQQESSGEENNTPD